ncbi:hypothetical protein [Aurantibacillus circumpalustris]|uniref:hypothetical protein n=1 Tax=Aurantibacillus circumpalustris TaxID=3036359 RepID=UPI00295BAAC1|nr:hypothetical protein [Aurantibacillus circumpalustris]
MNIQEKLDKINSTNLVSRINLLKELIELINYYKNLELKEEKLTTEILDSISGMRSSRFIETQDDLVLLDAAIEFTSLLPENKSNLKLLLKNALYYSNYYPENTIRHDLKKK